MKPSARSSFTAGTARRRRSSFDRPCGRRKWMVFANRRDAGRELAARLGAYRGRPDLVVLALPRGGVPVAFEIAEALDAPLDVFVVRKLGMPGHPEFAIGAIASRGVRVLNQHAIPAYGVTELQSDPVATQERE